jgi:hypothetical protein
MSMPIDPRAVSSGAKASRRSRRTDPSARALRDAILATSALVLAIYLGSVRWAHFDLALTGYALATLVTCAITTHRVSLFWRRPASAVYGRALARALVRPRDLLRAAAISGRDLVAQRFIARRSRARWVAHLLVSGGSTVAFAITLPLVWGWLWFTPGAGTTYVAHLFALPVAHFATDGILGWLVLNALTLAAIAVLVGASALLIARLRTPLAAGRRRVHDLFPLLLLLAVAASGLALPIAARLGPHGVFRAAALLHEACVVVLLIALPASKLAHVLVRPLKIGSELVRADAARVARDACACEACDGPLAAEPQLAAVRALLEARGLNFGDHGRLCPACRRRRLSTAQTRLLDAQFQPAHPRRAA